MSEFDIIWHCISDKTCPIRIFSFLRLEHRTHFEKRLAHAKQRYPHLFTFLLLFKKFSYSKGPLLCPNRILFPDFTLDIQIITVISCWIVDYIPSTALVSNNLLNILLSCRLSIVPLHIPGQLEYCICEENLGQNSPSGIHTETTHRAQRTSEYTGFESRNGELLSFSSTLSLTGRLEMYSPRLHPLQVGLAA